MGPSGKKHLKGLLRGMIMEKKKKRKEVEETLLCYREARGSTPEPAKMSPLPASLSWQLLGAPPKAGSGKHKGSLCKTFSKKKNGKNKCKCFPQLQGGGGQGTEQTPGLGLMRALSKEALSQTGLSLRRSQKGTGKENQMPWRSFMQFHAGHTGCNPSVVLGASTIKTETKR